MQQVCVILGLCLVIYSCDNEQVGEVQDLDKEVVSCDLVYMGTESLRENYSNSLFDKIRELANENIEFPLDLPDSLNFCSVENSVLSCRWVLVNDFGFWGEFFITTQDDSYTLLISFDSQKNISDLLYYKKAKRVNGKWKVFFSDYTYFEGDSILISSLDTSVQVMHPSQGKVCKEDVWILNQKTGDFDSLSD